MDSEQQEELEWAKKELQLLKEKVRSCILATVSSQGVPLSSYAPVFIDESGCFLVYVSAMAKHYTHLKKGRLASVTLIEDEAASDELFARKRLSVDCEAALIPRDSDAWESGMSSLQKRHGEIVGYLRDLTDFDLFSLKPSSGRLVLGFGKAYQISGMELDQVSFLGAGGHRSKS